MSQRHPDFSALAARIAISNLHKNTSGSPSGGEKTHRHDESAIPRNYGRIWEVGGKTKSQKIWETMGN
eukprot:739090-Pyramimonas_sp.AAC.1